MMFVNLLVSGAKKRLAASLLSPSQDSLAASHPACPVNVQEFTAFICDRLCEIGQSV
jgi:hypothetical protein